MDKESIKESVKSPYIRDFSGIAFQWSIARLESSIAMGKIA